MEATEDLCKDDMRGGTTRVGPARLSACFPLSVESRTREVAGGGARGGMVPTVYPLR